ncbi:MAG: apolipoprotein N-acyltransferase [Pseudomonadota bacterium]
MSEAGLAIDRGGWAARRSRDLWPFLTGILLTGAQAPVSLWPALLIGTGLLYWLLTLAQTARRAAWIGWWAGTGYFASGLFWIAEAFFVDIARHGWMAPFAILFLSTGLALFWGLGGWLFARARPAGWGAPLMFAGAWTFVELLRTYVLTGFPWNLLAYGWLETAVAQVSGMIGPHALGFVTLFFAAMLVRALEHRAVGVGIATIAVAAVPTVWALGQTATTPTSELDAPTVRVVQPNAPQHLKWTADGMREQYLNGLRATVDDGGADITIWPETSVPMFIGEPEIAYGGGLYRWQDIAAASENRPAIIGTRRRDGQRYYNSLAVVGPGGALVAQYDKHHLVPFGEYLPFADLLARWGLFGLASGGVGYSAGPGPRVVSADGVPPFLPLICYEAIFPHRMDAPGDRPRWIVHITNDAWFGNSAGPYQHLAQARFRAIETGLPVVRAANTGISAIIDAYGRVLEFVPLGTTGYAQDQLPPRGPEPLYARTGDTPLMAFLVVLGLISLVITKRKQA